MRLNIKNLFLNTLKNAVLYFGPPSGDGYLQEDGTFFYLTEDGDFYLVE